MDTITMDITSGGRPTAFAEKAAGLPPEFFGRKRQMKLHEKQLRLLRHLARYNLMEYPDCLDMLDTDGTENRTALSYSFRPLTKNGYVSKRKDGSVAILAKGRALFPEVTPLISTGGGAAERCRVMVVSRMAAWMERNGIPSFGELQEGDGPYFIPSACWRKIAPGILSTTRFAGMLIAGTYRLAVYDIGDGTMEWQVRAEGSLFYTRYGRYETNATGMLLVCRKEARLKAAQNMIRQTMWNRRQLLREDCVERNRPTRWSRSPIKLKAQYEHVYLTTPETLAISLRRILAEEEYIQSLCDRNGGRLSGSQGIGDIEPHPRRLFVNPATDLLKYVRFLSAVKTYLAPKEEPNYYPITIELYIQQDDLPIAKMYPELYGLEGLTVYVYRSKEDPDEH